MAGSEFNQIQCYERRCESCGVVYFQKHFEELQEKDTGQGTYKWKCWELGKVGVGHGG